MLGKFSRENVWTVLSHGVDATTPLILESDIIEQILCGIDSNLRDGIHKTWVISYIGGPPWQFEVSHGFLDHRYLLRDFIPSSPCPNKFLKSCYPQLTLIGWKYRVLAMYWTASRRCCSQRPEPELRPSNGGPPSPLQRPSIRITPTQSALENNYY